MRYLFVCFILISVNSFAQQPAEQIARLKHAPENEKIKIYINLSQIYAENQPDSAVHYANEGMQLAEKTDDLRGRALLLLALGRINMLHHHQDLSGKFYNEALGIFRSLNDEEQVGYTYDQLGLLDGAEQNTPAAIRDLGLAMKWYSNKRDSTGILETYVGLGRVYEEKSEPGKALGYYLKALAQYERRSEKPEAYFMLLENIGHLYEKRGDSKAALRYLKEGIGSSSHEGLRDTEIYLLNEEGNVYQEEGQGLQAMQTFKDALAVAKKYRQPEEQAQALINIAGLLKKQNATASLSDLQAALDIARHLQQPRLEARIYEAIAGVYRQEKNYREAIYALDEQHHLLDSLLKADTAKDIAALDSSYALEASEEKIGRLQHVGHMEKTELYLSMVLFITAVVILAMLWFYLWKTKRLNAALKDSNRIKDTLFSVIGHDLKGPAASAVQLFEMIDTEDFTEAEVRGMVSELGKQTRASLELLQSLFEWGRTQLRGIRVNPVVFDPQPVMDRCIHLLSRQAADKNIYLSVNIPGGMHVCADADHFEFIIRNLLSNAIKFSHEGGRVEVNIQLPIANKELIFIVKDNGIGISKAGQETFLTGNIKVNFGTNKEKGSGLGLLLTKDFIKANNGRIWLESRVDEGTTFFVALPAA